jgi:hypothetical protein
LVSGYKSGLEIQIRIQARNNDPQSEKILCFESVFRIRIQIRMQIRKFLGLPELDLLVRGGTDPKYCFKELNILFGGVKASLPWKSFMNKYSIAIVDQLN